MKLTLDGFKCYSSPTVIEWDTSQPTLLIDAPSGYGKSSLFKAVAWALYGKEKNTYTWSSSKRKCMVQLEFNNICIQRQKNPERLSVVCGSDVNLTGESAQQWIIQQFGTREYWMACSYIQQSELSALITGTKDERLSLLEEMAFGNDKPGQLVEQLAAKKLAISKQVDKLHHIIESKNKPEKPTADETTYTEELLQQKKILLKQQRIRHDNKLKYDMLKQTYASLSADLKTLIDQCISDDEFSRLKSRLEKSKKLFNEYRYITSQLRVQDLIQMPQGFSTWDDVYHHVMAVERQMKIIGDDDITTEEDYIATMATLKHVIEHHDIVNKYNNIDGPMCECDSAPTQEMIDAIKQQEKKYKEWNSQLAKLGVTKEQWREAKSLVGVIPYVKDYQSWRNNNTKESKQALETERKTLEHDLDIATRGLQVHSCPHCQGFVRVQGVELVKASVAPATNDDLQKIKNKLKELEAKLTRVEQKERAYMLWSRAGTEDMYTRILNLPEKLQTVGAWTSLADDVELPSTCSDELIEHFNAHEKSRLYNLMPDDSDEEVAALYQISLKQLETRLQQLQSLAPWKMPLSVTKDQVVKAKEAYKWKLALEKLSSVDDVNNNTEEYIAQLETQLATATSMKTQISMLTKQIHDISEKLRHVAVNDGDAVDDGGGASISELEQWIETAQMVIPQWRAYQEYMALINESQKTEQELTSISYVVEKAKWLEHHILENYISTLNFFLESTLQQIFEDPITITFELTGGVSEKPAIQFSMLYKGGQNESIAELSGGEKVRVSLAVTLALAMNHSFPVLLLDECFGSLDQNNKEKCLAALKDVLRHKTSIIIAHREVEGDFDVVQNFT